MTTAIDRHTICRAIRIAVEPMPSVIAMWEGGSASFDRVDEWSDLDLHLLVEDGAAAEALAATDAALAALSPIEIRYELPQPAWHGMDQVFYRLRDAGEFLLVDLAVMQRGAANKFDEVERHGPRRMLFDKTGEAAGARLDRAAHGRRLRDRLDQLRRTFPLFQSLVKKEIRRGNLLGALAFYHAFTLQPLHTIVRMRHCPDRYDFGPRYARTDLPPVLVDELESLWLVASLDELDGKRARAERRFFETLAEIDSSWNASAEDPAVGS